MLGEQRCKPIEQVVDRPILVIVDLVRASLRDSGRREFRTDGIDCRIDRGGAHRARSRTVMAPALLRLASMPWPKARQTSSSMRPLRTVVAEACVFAAKRCASQSCAADAQALLPSKQTSRVPIGFGE